MKAFLDSFFDLLCPQDPCGPGHPCGSMWSSSGKGGGAIYHREHFCDRTVHFLIHDHHCFRVSSLEIYKLFFPQLLEPFHLISLLCCAERKLGCFCKLEI